MPKPPEKKKNKKNIFMGILLLVGISAEEEIKLIFSPPEDLLREVIIDSIKDSAKEFDWVAEDDACQECLYLAAEGPYPIDYAIDTHPHCRCYPVPR